MFPSQFKRNYSQWWKRTNVKYNFEIWGSDLNVEVRVSLQCRVSRAGLHTMAQCECSRLHHLLKSCHTVKIFDPNPQFFLHLRVETKHRGKKTCAARSQRVLHPCRQEAPSTNRPVGPCPSETGSTKCKLATMPHPSYEEDGLCYWTPLAK